MVEAPAPTVSMPGGHPADGMTMHVPCGDDVTMTIIDPRSFHDGGLEWVMRYGNPQSIRFTVASVLADYTALVSGNMTMKEAARRLRIMRAYYKAALRTPSRTQGET